VRTYKVQKWLEVAYYSYCYSASPSRHAWSSSEGEIVGSKSEQANPGSPSKRTKKRCQDEKTIQYTYIKNTQV